MDFAQFDNAAMEVWQSKLFSTFSKIRDEVCLHSKKRLEYPIFHLNGDINWKWGSWNPSNRVMTFSLRLLRNYEWGAVEHVMRHEVAHQIVSEIFNMDCYGVAHGEAWARACLMVNISPVRCDSSEFLSSFKGVEDISMVKKVRKLLVHANDDAVTEEEASIFMSKARELILRYDIDMQDVGGDKRVFVSRPFGLNFKRWPTYMWALGSLLNKHYNVECIMRPTYIHNVGNMNRLELFGEPSNLDIAEYVGHALLAQADYLYDEYKRKYQLEEKERKAKDIANGFMPFRGRRFSKASFMDGLIKGYMERLNQDKDKAIQNVRESYDLNNVTIIPMYNKQLLKEMYGQAYPNRVTSNYLSSRGEGRSSGREAGLNLRLAKGVNSNGNRRLQLK